MEHQLLGSCGDYESGCRCWHCIQGNFWPEVQSRGGHRVSHIPLSPQSHPYWWEGQTGLATAVHSQTWSSCVQGKTFKDNLVPQRETVISYLFLIAVLASISFGMEYGINKIGHTTQIFCTNLSKLFSKSRFGWKVWNSLLQKASSFFWRQYFSCAFLSTWTYLKGNIILIQSDSDPTKYKHDCYNFLYVHGLGTWFMFIPVHSKLY